MADTVTESLLPCPFCGGEGIVVPVPERQNADVCDVYVRCESCDAVGPAILFEWGSGQDDPHPEAIAAWNRRTAPAEPVAWRKPEHPAATEPLFIDAKLRTEEWMMGVFTVPLYAAPPASPTVSDEMVDDAIAIFFEDLDWKRGLGISDKRVRMRSVLLAALGGQHD